MVKAQIQTYLHVINIDISKVTPGEKKKGGGNATLKKGLNLSSAQYKHCYIASQFGILRKIYYLGLILPPGTSDSHSVYTEAVGHAFFFEVRAIE